MFTGIVESLGEVTAIEKDGGNTHFTIKSAFTSELQIDQSVSHNGACLTVVAINGEEYTVTAIEETLEKTCLSDLAVGAPVNLERCMRMNARLDGHIVQGHVDTTAVVTSVEERDGSWHFAFEYPSHPQHVTVPKGSICVSGTSLTVVDSEVNSFSVAIIPYTYEHTIFKTFKPGTRVNLEFDIIGKYVARLMGK